MSNVFTPKSIFGVCVHKTDDPSFDVSVMKWHKHQTLLRCCDESEMALYHRQLQSCPDDAFS